MIRSLNDAQIHWWRSRWWAEDQYVHAIEGKISLADVDAKIERVARIFDASWGVRTGFHPVHYWLLSRGLEPLQFLIGLGSDLEKVAGSPGLNSLIRCLREPREFESTLLELSLGAILAASDHAIEFRPRLPNGKEADFSACKNSNSVFFEVKKMRESEAQAAASNFSSRLGFALTDLARPPDGPIAGFRYNVELSPALTTILEQAPMWLEIASKFYLCRLLGNRLALFPSFAKIGLVGYFSLQFSTLIGRWRTH